MAGRSECGPALQNHLAMCGDTGCGGPLTRSPILETFTGEEGDWGRQCFCAGENWASNPLGRGQVGKLWDGQIAERYTAVTKKE